MKRNYTWSLFFILIPILFNACRNTADTREGQDNGPFLEELLPGTWEAVSVYVEVNSAEGKADSSFVFRINDGDWKEVFSVSPPLTYFQKDNKYRVEYRDRRDSVMSVSRGIWNLMGDTLMMIEPDQSFQFLVNYEKGLMYFRGMRDWDDDGAEDDDYQEVKRRVSIGTD